MSANFDLFYLDTNRANSGYQYKKGSPKGPTGPTWLTQTTPTRRRMPLLKKKSDQISWSPWVVPSRE